MNGFKRACPSGNHMIDAVEHKQRCYCERCGEEITEREHYDLEGLCGVCYQIKMEEEAQDYGE